jgi:hypothetical protein
MFLQISLTAGGAARVGLFFSFFHEELCVSKRLTSMKITFSKFGRISGNDPGTSNIVSPTGQVLGYIERVVEAEKIGSSRQDTYTVVGYNLTIWGSGLEIDYDDKFFTNLVKARNEARTFFEKVPS